MPERKTQGRVVHLRVLCVAPPEYLQDQPQEFGIQDNHQALHAGQWQADGAIAYAIDLEAVPGDALPAIRWRGEFVHGTPSAPFLYLSWRPVAVTPPTWTKRIKVPLPALTWEQIAARPLDDILEVRVDGTRSATATFIGGGWTWDVEAG